MSRSARSGPIRLLLAALLLAVPVGAEPPLEYQVQAAYVSKFLRFVEWPEEPAGEFRVGVSGPAEFQEAMHALDGYAIGERRVRVRRVESSSAVRDLHVLVIGPSRSRARSLGYLEAARERPVLTVSDAADFIESGGIIQFLVVDDTMRFAINRVAARRAGLKLSARLLRLGRKLD